MSKKPTEKSTKLKRFFLSTREKNLLYDTFSSFVQNLKRFRRKKPNFKDFVMSSAGFVEKSLSL